MRSGTSEVSTFLLGVVLCAASDAAEIRVRNDTAEDLRSVVVGHRNFGNIGKGQTSQYQSWDNATEVAQASARSTTGVIGFWPKNPHALAPLGKGHFTYVLSRTSDGLAIRAEKDPE